MKEPEVIMVGNFLTPKERARPGKAAYGRWRPPRGHRLRRFALWKRIKLAWGVFTGRYDALDWEEQE